MEKVKVENRTIEIEDITLWSCFSTLYLKPKFFISFELMDFFGDDDCEIYFSLKHIELDGYSDAKELINNEIHLNEIAINKTFNTEYLNGEEYKIVSVSFYISHSPKGHTITGKGTFLNSQTDEINQFQFDSNATVNPTNLLSVSHSERLFQERINRYY